MFKQENSRFAPAFFYKLGYGAGRELQLSGLLKTLTQGKIYDY